MVARQERPTIQQDQATHQAITHTFAFLKGRGVDGNAVAQRLGVGYQTVSAIKMGHRPPSIEAIEVLWAFVHEALNAEALSQYDFIAAGQLALEWQQAIIAQTEATMALKREVTEKLTRLQSEPQPTEADLMQLAACANETVRLAGGLQQLTKLRTAWASTGQRFIQTWEHIRATRYPDGPLWGIVRAEGEESAQCKGTKTRRRGKRTSVKS